MQLYAPPYVLHAPRSSSSSNGGGGGGGGSNIFQRLRLPSLLNQSKDLLWDVTSRTNKELLAAELRSTLSYCVDVRLCVSVTIIVTVKKKGKGKALPVQASYRPRGFLKVKAPRFRYGTCRW